MPDGAAPTAPTKFWQRHRVAIAGVGEQWSPSLDRRRSGCACLTLATPRLPHRSNTGPFTGTFTADFGPELDFAESHWKVRRRLYAGDVASAVGVRGQRVRGHRIHRWASSPRKDVVFDDVGGRWLAVATSPGKCKNLDARTVLRDLATTAARRHHVRRMEYRLTRNGCFRKRNVTFTRTGDTDV